MEVEYQTNSLRKLVESEDKLSSKFGDVKITRGILSRIRHFEMADNLFDFDINQPNARIHPLKGAKKGEIAVDAVNKICPIRCVFITTDGENITQDMFNKEKRKTVTSILIVDIGDYH